MKFIDSFVDQIKNKRVLVRVDYNVPLDNGKVKDDTRIIESKETINFLLNLGCDVILLTHLGRPKTLEDKQKYTTKHIFNYLIEKNIFGSDVSFIDNFDIEINYRGGMVYLFENVRFFDGETKNSLDLARKFAKFGDIFVNDAFGSLHRVHSSVAGISNFLPTFFGFLVKREIESLSKFLNPERPFVVFLGGAKISDKIELIKKIKADKIYIGGAMATTIYKYKGYNVGKSLYEELDLKELVEDGRIVLPTKFVVVDDENMTNAKEVKLEQIVDEMIVDCLFEDLSFVEDSRMVFWNGPMGIFEKGFTKGSENILYSLERSKGFRAIGGGDTVRFINKFAKEDLKKYVDFVSTGGGATLEFLQNGSLAAIDYIQSNKTIVG